MKILPVLLLLLLQTSLKAQGPLHFIEHDWTFQVGKARFGLYQDSWGFGLNGYGGERRTTLYFGNTALTTKTQAFQRRASVVSFAALALLLCALLPKGAQLLSQPRHVMQGDLAPGEPESPRLGPH